MGESQLLVNLFVVWIGASAALAAIRGISEGNR